MTFPTIRAAGLLAVALLTSPVSAQDADEGAPRTTRTYDLADLAPETVAPMRRFVTDGGVFTVFVTGWKQSTAFSELAERSPTFSLGEFPSLMGGVVGEVDEEATVDAIGRRIVVTATAEGLRRADAAVEVLRRASGGAAVVEVEEFVLPPDAHVAAAPDAATVAAWREQDVRGGGRVLGLTLEPGVWRLAEDIERVRGIVDLDVEIAQDAAIADPVARDIDVGTRVLARAAPTMDGRVALTVVAACADLRGPPRRVTFSQDELGAVDLADIEASFVSTDLVLAEGDARTIVLARPGGANRVLVFRLVDAGFGEVGGTLRFLPHGALTSPRSALRLSIDDGESGDFSPFGIQGGETAQRLGTDEVFEFVQQELEPEMNEGTVELTDIGWLLGGAFAVRAEESVIARAEARLRSLESDFLRQAHIEIRLEERAPGAAEGDVVGMLAGEVPLGFPVALGAYRVAAFVAGQDVAVAAKSQISDPVISAALAGVLANVVVTQAGGGDYSAALELRVMEFGEPRLRSSSATDVGDIEIVDGRSLYSEARVRVRGSRPAEILLGRSPFSGEPWWLVAVVSVAPVR